MHTVLFVIGIIYSVLCDNNVCARILEEIVQFDIINVIIFLWSSFSITLMTYAIRKVAAMTMV